MEYWSDGKSPVLHYSITPLLPFILNTQLTTYHSQLTFLNHTHKQFIGVLERFYQNLNESDGIRPVQHPVVDA